MKGCSGPSETPNPGHGRAGHRFLRHVPLGLLLVLVGRDDRRLLPCGPRQHPKPPHDRPEQLPCQVPLRQQQSVVSRVFHEPATRLHQPLLQTRQRPRINPFRQPEPPPQVAQVVRDHAEPQPHLVSPPGRRDACLPTFPSLQAKRTMLLGRPSLSHGQAPSIVSSS